jgi:hypothetical protein
MRPTAAIFRSATAQSGSHGPPGLGKARVLAQGWTSGGYIGACSVTWRRGCAAARDARCVAAPGGA